MDIIPRLSCFEQSFATQGRDTTPLRQDSTDRPTTEAKVHMLRKNSNLDMKEMREEDNFSQSQEQITRPMTCLDVGSFASD